MFAAKEKSAPPEFWIAAAQVTKPAKSAFYAKLEETLESFGFAAKVRTPSGAGRPGIDPVVYLKTMMVGFFENLPGKRAIAARCGTQSQYGQKLLRRRGMHRERAFAHILDCGGMRRATVRGRQNLNKRFKLAAAFYNLAQLRRNLFGIGAPKQCAAMGAGGLGAVLGPLALWLIAIFVNWTSIASKEAEKVTWFDWSSQPMKKAASNKALLKSAFLQQSASPACPRNVTASFVWGFPGDREWNSIPRSDGIDLALQRVDLFLEGKDVLELVCR